MTGASPMKRMRISGVVAALALLLGVGALGFLLLLQHPGLGLVALAALSFTLPLTIGTGSAVELTAPVLFESAVTTAQTFFAEPADYNGDGISDIAVSVSTNNGQAVDGLEQAVYIIFGRSDWPEEFDVFGQADVGITSPDTGKLSVASLGDIGKKTGEPVNESYDDLIIYQGDNAYLYYGQALWDSGVALEADFTNAAGNGSDTDGFTFDGDLWHLTDGRGTDDNHTDS